MSITLSGYEFEGPYSSTGSLKNQSGAYAALTKTSANRYSVLDVGESSEVRDRVENHDRASCWRRNANSGVYYAAYYANQERRRKVADEVRDSFRPPCGER